MTPGHRAMLRVTVLAAALLATLAVIATLTSGILNHEVWTRDHPLTNPLTVTEVRGGALTLADGRVLRPAGIRRAEGITPDDYDLALRVLTAQGVLVDRTLDDTRAMLTAEPKFYNWCGTRGMEGDPFAHWAGCYVQSPVSEFLIDAGYAEPDLDQPGLTARERWRLEGAAQLHPSRDAPITARAESMAFRVEGDERMFADYNTWLEITWPSHAPQD